MAISNLHDKGLVQTGFVIGTATAGAGSVSAVQVSLDGGAFTAATGTTSWQFKLPTGSSTWRDASAHSIAVRSVDPSNNPGTAVTINVRKGNNLDFNGDGYPDAVFPSGSSPAQVFVFYSRGNGGVPNTDYSTADVTITGATGFAIAAGDVNGDGYGDLVIGAYSIDGGSIFVFQSKGSAGLNSTNLGTGGTADTTLTGNAALTGDFGYSVAVGDVNGDGYADVVTGTLIAQRSATQDGSALVFLSHPALPGIPNCNMSASCAADTTINGPTSSNLGSNIAVGDVNGDGVADLAVASNVGVFVFHGVQNSGIASCDLLAGCTANTKITGPAGTDGYGSQSSPALLMADVNADGFVDLVALNTNLYVFTSNGANGFNPSSAHATVTVSAATAVINPPTSLSTSFFGVGLGDVNGDGAADAIGMLNYPGMGEDIAFEVLSSGGAGIAPCNLAGSCTAGASLAASNTSNFTGFNTIVTEDVNGDGYMDIVTTPSTFDCGSSMKGYIFLSKGAAGLPTVDLTQSGTADTTIALPTVTCF